MDETELSEPVKLFNIRVIAERLDLHPKSVELLIRRGELGSVKIGTRVLVRADQLQAFIDAHSVAAGDS
jgi:excisionase family DNA binding protein